MSEAETYRRAARIVAAMDPRTQWRLPEGVSSGHVGRQYSSHEAAIWDAFGGAAIALRMIADEIERGQQAAQNPPTE